jgi:aminoglycoside N3'-acetyltransferase
LDDGSFPTAPANLMQNPTAIPITATELLAELRTAGLGAGDVLIVHASFKSLGPVAGGPAAVVTALLNALGPAGTLLMPTFADPQTNGEFHVATTPRRTGAITEAFRAHVGAVRSHHPTHAVTAAGPRAAEFIAGHEHTSGLGVASPFHRAALAGASVLMIGCDLRAASIVHIATSTSARQSACCLTLVTRWTPRSRCFRPIPPPCCVVVHIVRSAPGHERSRSESFRIR